MGQSSSGGNDENHNSANQQLGGDQGLLQKGTQHQDRYDMMSNANLAEAAQNFNNQ